MINTSVTVGNRILSTTKASIFNLTVSRFPVVCNFDQALVLLCMPAMTFYFHSHLCCLTLYSLHLRSRSFITITNNRCRFIFSLFFKVRPLLAYLWHARLCIHNGYIHYWNLACLIFWFLSLRNSLYHILLLLVYVTDGRLILNLCSSKRQSV